MAMRDKEYNATMSFRILEGYAYIELTQEDTRIFISESALTLSLRVNVVSLFFRFY